MILQNLLTKSPIVPVVTLEKAEQAVPLAEALLAGGIGVIEITLRTEAGLASIAEVAKKVKGMTVGAGTITNPEQFKQAAGNGAEFIVSPGLTQRLAEGVIKEKTPFLPGVSTTSEILHAMEYGLDFLKFFPAGLSGGPNALKQFGGLFPNLKFCPTGGVNIDNMNDYLRLKNVVCVGGSWVCPDVHITSGNWTEITRMSAEAIAAVRR